MIGVFVVHSTEFEWRITMMEGQAMPGIVGFPQLVRQAVEGFGDLFYGEPQRRHFGEYLTGLFIAQRKTVSSISLDCARVFPNMMQRFSSWRVATIWSKTPRKNAITLARRASEGIRSFPSLARRASVRNPS